MAVSLPYMKNKTAYGYSTPEILWNSAYVGHAVTLAPECFNEEGVCLAGTPIGKAEEYGARIANNSEAVGILLHDVYVHRPQATIVIGGYINTAVAEEWSGNQIYDEAMNAMKNVVFMNKPNRLK